MEAGSENYQHCKFSRCRNPADIVGLAKPVTVEEIGLLSELEPVLFLWRNCID
jgi:hypothetical protein